MPEFKQDKKTSFFSVVRFKGAIVAAGAFMLAGCVSSGGSDAPVYNPGTIHVEAQQDVLEDNVYRVKEDSRELRDRFDAIERLYVDLVKQRDTAQTEVAELIAAVDELTRKLDMVAKNSASTAAVYQMTQKLVSVQRDFQNLEGRMFSVEANTTAVAEMLQEGGAMANTVATQQSATPVSAAPGDDGAVKYGIHLGSFRSMEVVPGSWSAFKRVFKDELNGLEALIYSQSQQGVGEFLRLIAGPLTSEQDAEALCSVIRLRAREQFCSVTEYQGEPLDN